MYMSIDAIGAPLPSIAAAAQDAYLVHARTGFSMCSGALTSEMARSVLQTYVRQTGYDMNIRTVALWDACTQYFSWIKPELHDKTLSLRLDIVRVR